MSVDAANSLDVPQDELKAILGEVACDIHGCYVLKSAQNDPFRFSLPPSLPPFQRVFRKVTHSICLQHL